MSGISMSIICHYYRLVKQCHKPPVTGNSNIPPIEMVIWGMVYDCFSYIIEEYSGFNQQ